MQDVEREDTASLNILDQIYQATLLSLEKTPKTTKLLNHPNVERRNVSAPDVWFHICPILCCISLIVLFSSIHSWFSWNTFSFQRKKNNHKIHIHFSCSCFDHPVRVHRLPPMFGICCCFVTLPSHVQYFYFEFLTFLFHFLIFD